MLVIVTGIHREAVLFPPEAGELVVSGKDNSDLAPKIEAAISEGGTAVISVGICGGLAPDLAIGKVVIANQIIWNDSGWPTDARWSDAMAMRIPDAVRGTIAGTDTILITPDTKTARRQATGAIAVDMESYIAAEIAAAHGLPFASLRVISDAAAHSLPPLVREAIGDDGKVRIGTVLRSLAGNPAQIPGVLRIARNSDKALASLLRCFDLLGAGFACPYLG